MVKTVDIVIELALKVHFAIKSIICVVCRDAILTSSINCLTSFIAGFVIFSVLGYMANKQDKTVEEVGLEGKSNHNYHHEQFCITP